MTATQSVQLSSDARSDTGRKRAANEDSFLAVPPVFAVADGMGGHEAGAQASAHVVAALRETLCTGGPVDLVRVSAAIDEASRRVSALAATRERGAGSTLTGVILVVHDGRPHWLIVNVGDSRVYRLVGGYLEQLTVDHSLVQERVDAGTLRPEDRGTAPDKNVITRALGSVDARADSWLMPVTTGERLLVCSDGLHGELSDEQLREILVAGGRPAATTAALVEAANRAGGRDNVTAVVVDVLSGGDPGGDGPADTRESHAWTDDGDTVPV
ncbi:serine/threonine-protein phosphatase [Leifsonia sp. ZF2019]|uniref:PP2C family protein-serine/threonine phosphatase n=1 Tax=Leifsonia sp. ZF2019 TaxID=2781978 RepID=UPI001CC1A1C4|nr:protein phosphatase 2C domain-containing protein [Leifsonia sp. ZF2019]UAJ80484.1 serine/threonine-protein phosphatase [Leifsonia sp. ZF2019]